MGSSIGLLYNTYLLLHVQTMILKLLSAKIVTQLKLFIKNSGRCCRIFEWFDFTDRMYGTNSGH